MFADRVARSHSPRRKQNCSRFGLDVQQSAVRQTLLDPADAPTSSKDREPLILASCAERMREAAAWVGREALWLAGRSRQRRDGRYEGALCGIVGAGGDGYSTLNAFVASAMDALSSLSISIDDRLKALQNAKTGPGKQNTVMTPYLLWAASDYTL